MNDPVNTFCPFEKLNVTPEQFSGREEFWNFVKESGIDHIWDAGSKIYNWNPNI